MLVLWAMLIDAIQLGPQRASIEPVAGMTEVKVEVVVMSPDARAVAMASNELPAVI
jgi:hypothetical protein